MGLSGVLLALLSPRGSSSCCGRGSSGRPSSAAACLLVVLSGVLCLAHIGGVQGYLFEGSPTSFAQFPRWLPGGNGSLQFQFLTSEPNGLLLYTDDGGSFEFFEVKLVEGSVRLRYNLGGGAQLLTAGRGLNDQQWHSVRVTRDYNRTRLEVDGILEVRIVSRALDHEFGSAGVNTPVWVGGLPDLVARQVGGRLTLQVVTLEPRFRGHIKGLTYITRDSIPRHQDIVSSQVSA
ncbi:unnamed protein product, partial [Meganyctiphanes norvegica]